MFNISEATAIKLLAKYNKENFPDNLGLSENNVIFRQHNLLCEVC